MKMAIGIFSSGKSIATGSKGFVSAGIAMTQTDGWDRVQARLPDLN